MIFFLQRNHLPSSFGFIEPKIFLGGGLNKINTIFIVIVGTRKNLVCNDLDSAFLVNMHRNLYVRVNHFEEEGLKPAFNFNTICVLYNMIVSYQNNHYTSLSLYFLSK